MEVIKVFMLKIPMKMWIELLTKRITVKIISMVFISLCFLNSAFSDHLGNYKYEQLAMSIEGHYFAWLDEPETDSNFMYIRGRLHAYEELMDLIYLLDRTNAIPSKEEESTPHTDYQKDPQEAKLEKYRDLLKRFLNRRQQTQQQHPLQAD